MYFQIMDDLPTDWSPKNIILYLVLPPPIVLDDTLIIPNLILLTKYQNYHSIYSKKGPSLLDYFIHCLQVMILIDIFYDMLWNCKQSRCQSFIIRVMMDEGGMLGQMFVTEDDLMNGEGHVMTSWERLPRNCADKLPLPEIPRKQGYPMGLKNQGATCYLNSLFQVLFHTPELRQCILKLPLCINNSQTPSDFVSEQKQSFLLGFQRLFSEMSICDQRAVGTNYINKAFKWQGSEHAQQQDMQQAMRVIFDTITRALYQTEYHKTVHSLFRGMTTRYKTCTICGQTSDRPEQFFDVSLQVKGLSSVEESIKLMTTAQSMEGDNAIFCDTCNAKTNMWLGTRFQQLPGTIIFALNRYDFDYQTFQRVRLNSYFEYQLELDLSSYLMPNADPDYHKYELYGVVVHRGTAHGGHYLCYVRDLRQETDWEKGLIQTKEQEEKIKSSSQNKDKDKHEDKEFQMKEPTNKKLLENWYQINDNVTTAVSANKLTSKFEGSDSAYILFYRRKSLILPKNKEEVPKYFKEPILQANTEMLKQRQKYDEQKKQIILNIEGEEHKLKVTMPIDDLKQAFISEGQALVMQSQHNGLPYYPMQVSNSKDVVYAEGQTIESLGMPHETIWKKYKISSPEYIDISGAIGKDRIPLELLLVIQGEQNKRIVSHSDQNFLMLRMKIEKMVNISYENQIINLVSQYKQTILTDKIQNDDMLLPKLGIFHTSQLHIKSRGNQEEEDAKEGKKENSNLICFVIERDEVIGLKRFYYEKSKTLNDLFKHFLKMEGIKDDHKRRFRNLANNRLLYSDVYNITLEELDFSEELVRLRLERGQIPVKGDILVKVKNQSSLDKKEGTDDGPELERIFDPNTTIKDVKEWACHCYKVDSSLHKLYLTDWVKQPIRSLNRQHLTLFEANFSREDTVCLRDIYSPIGDELVHLQVYSTITGCPDTAEKEGIHVKIQQFKTVKELKQLMINTLELGSISPEMLRLRQIKRDYMFGSIWRDMNKSVKSVTINSNKVVYQILSEPEMLTDSQIVVVLKKRNREKRIYDDNISQLIFQAGKTPLIEEFDASVKTKLDVKDDIIMAKYVHHEFQWIQLSRKNIQMLAKRKKGKQQNNKKKGNQGHQGQQQGKKDQNKKKQEESKSKNKNQKEEDQKDEIQTKEELQKGQQANQKETQDKPKPQNKQNKQQKTEDKEGKGKKPEQKHKKQKKGGKGGNQPQKDISEECQNLRKAPVLLKDGDIIGWGLALELEGDDLQTDEDAAFRLQVKKQPGKFKGGKEKGFGLGVNF